MRKLNRSLPFFFPILFSSIYPEFLHSPGSSVVIRSIFIRSRDSNIPHQLVELTYTFRLGVILTRTSLSLRSDENSEPGLIGTESSRRSRGFSVEIVPVIMLIIIHSYKIIIYNKNSIMNINI